MYLYCEQSLFINNQQNKNVKWMYGWWRKVEEKRRLHRGCGAVSEWRVASTGLVRSQAVGLSAAALTSAQPAAASHLLSHWPRPRGAQPSLASTAPRNQRWGDREYGLEWLDSTVTSHSTLAHQPAPPGQICRVLPLQVGNFHWGQKIFLLSPTGGTLATL